MKIIKLNVHDEPMFNKLALSYGTIFNTIAWTNIFSDTIQRYGIYNKGNELIGGLITYKEKKCGLSFYRNPPFTPMIGPFLKVEAKNPVSIMDIWKEVITTVANFMDELPYSIISLSLNKNLVDVQPFIWKKFKVIPGYTYLLDLTRSTEDIWREMSNERRKNINKGTKDGLFAAKITDYKIIKALVIKTFLRQGKKINEFYLDKILFEFANNDNSFAFVTFLNESPIACAFFTHDRNTTYYILGGYNHHSKHHGAGALSMWEAIKYSKNLGLNYFDFEGSMIPRIERYFRGFGGRLMPYYRINKASLLIEILLKFFKRELF